MDDGVELGLVGEAFARNSVVNGIVIGALTEDDLAAADGVGGWDVGQHLGHVIEFRYGWLSAVSPAHADTIPSVAEAGDAGEPILMTTALSELAAALELGDRAVLAAVAEAVGAGRSFQGPYASDPRQLLVHTIVHDAHHRGQIVSLLRAGGRRTRDQLVALEEATWPRWRR